MTKARPPVSFAQAMSRTIGVLGADRVAAIARRAQRWVYACSDPDLPTTPTVTQAVALDVAFQAAGGSGAPFHETYAAMLDLQISAVLADRSALAADLAAASEECGQAISASIALTSPDAGDNAPGHALAEIEEGISSLTRLMRRIKSFNGPRAAEMGA